MPRVESLICDHCGKKFDGVRATHHDPAISWKLLCDECMEKSNKSDKTQWLIGRRKGKSMEQRLEWVEEYIFEHFIYKTLFDNLPTNERKKK